MVLLIQCGILEDKNMEIKQTDNTVDFNTKEGKEKIKEYIKEIVEEGNKEKLSNLLFEMFSLLLEHENKFNIIKTNI